MCEWIPVIFKIYKTRSNRYPGVQVLNQKHLNKIKHCLIKQCLILFKWWPNISHIVRAERLSSKCGEWLRYVVVLILFILFPFFFSLIFLFWICCCENVLVNAVWIAQTKRTVSDHVQGLSAISRSKYVKLISCHLVLHMSGEVLFSNEKLPVQFHSEEDVSKKW